MREFERYIKKIAFWKYYWNNARFLQGFLVAGYALGFILHFGVGLFCLCINVIALVGTYINWKKL